MGIHIVGLAVTVPKNISTTNDLVERFGKETTQKIEKATGVKTRHVVTGEMKTMELASEAAKEVFLQSGISASDIEGIILITQTPEYKLPATACILQDKLGVPKNSLAFDINLGCSGYPYGIIIANSLLESGLIKRLLLIVGDITSSTASPEDQSTYPLFADAFSATIIEKCNGQGDLLGISYGTDGSGWKHLINPIGSIRYRNINEYNDAIKNEDFVNIKYPEYTYMDGNEIFVFCLKTIPKMILDAINNSGLEKENIDFFLFHQANLFIINHIMKKLNIDPEKVPISIDQFGNTSSASIPLTASNRFANKNLSEPLTVAMIGFGVGYSWATTIMRLNPSVIYPIKEV